MATITNGRQTIQGAKWAPRGKFWYVPGNPARYYGSQWRKVQGGGSYGGRSFETPFSENYYNDLGRDQIEGERGLDDERQGSLYAPEGDGPIQDGRITEDDNLSSVEVEMILKDKRIELGYETDDNVQYESPFTPRPFFHLEYYSKIAIDIPDTFKIQHHLTACAWTDFRNDCYMRYVVLQKLPLVKPISLPLVGLLIRDLIEVASGMILVFWSIKDNLSYPLSAPYDYILDPLQGGIPDHGKKLFHLWGNHGGNILFHD